MGDIADAADYRARVDDCEKVRAPPTPGVDFEYKCAWQESNLPLFGSESF
jgi:hypothetical protein